jgi:protein-S-isoprenylcysteine O-methyltransferase Ste14
MTPALLFRLAWGIWALSWLAAAVWTGRTVKRASTGITWLSRGMVAVGAVFLFSKTSAALHAARLWHVGYDGAWALGGLVVLSLLFAWWARIHLGKLWSGTITRKEGHYVVDTGPYAVVRHPIYTGAIAATLATAAAEATLPAVIGLVLITLGLWLKARTEERFLREELGPEAYDAYRRRVPMLLPFGPKPA